MDLDIEEVSQLLNVSTSTIRRWLAKGIIPAYRLNQQYRFSSIEIEDWVMSHKMGKREKAVPFVKEEEVVELCGDTAQKIVGKKVGSHTYSLFRAINKGGVISDLEGSSKEEIIERALKKIAKDLSLDAEVLSELFLDRERLMPTSLNNGMGIPHTRDFLLSEGSDVVFVVYPKNAIEYGALDGKPVHTLFFLMACDEKRHLQLLAKIAHFASQTQFVDFLLQKPNKEKLLTYLKNYESES